MTTWKGCPATSAARQASLMPSWVWTLSWRGSYPPPRSSRKTSITRRVLAAVALAFLVLASGKFGLLGRCHALGLVPAPEREVEGGPFAHLALRPDPAAVPVNDTRHRGQS